MKQMKVHLGLSVVSLIIVTIVNQLSFAIGQTEEIPLILYRPLVMDATFNYGVGVKQSWGVDLQKMETVGPSIEFHLFSFVTSWIVLWIILFLLFKLVQRLRFKLGKTS